MSIVNDALVPSGNLIVVDNFYNNAKEVREYILKQEFKVKGNYPGRRTRSYASDKLKDIIQKYVEPYGGKITDFPMKEDAYNGSFQYTTSRDRSWIHVDSFNNWGGVVYLTPDAPVSSGTAFYKYKGGSMYGNASIKGDPDTYSQDFTKWEMVDSVGNIFNRLILFNSKRYHISMDYFGTNLENGRLFQVFFFSTEK
jgi:hypothetical protein